MYESVHLTARGSELEAQIIASELSELDEKFLLAKQ